MKITLGLSAHSGWAALVALGRSKHRFELIDRRRIDLVEEEWAKQPYHAAEELEPSEARIVVERGVKAAHKNAKRAIQTEIKRARGNGHEVVGCSVLVGEPMPDWTTDQILAVHFRMHKAEGVLFRQAVAEAARSNGLKVLEVPHKRLSQFAEEHLKSEFRKVAAEVTALGKLAGPPWGKDQKDAALAAALPLLGVR